MRLVLPVVELVEDGLVVDGQSFLWHTVLDLKGKQNGIVVWVESEIGQRAVQGVSGSHSLTEIREAWQVSMRSRLKLEGVVETAEIPRMITPNGNVMLVASLGMLGFSVHWFHKVFEMWRNLREYQAESLDLSTTIALAILAIGPLLLALGIGWIWWASRSRARRFVIPGRRDAPVLGDSMTWHCRPGCLVSESGESILFDRLGGGELVRRLLIQRDVIRGSSKMPTWRWFRIVRSTFLWPVLGVALMHLIAPDTSLIDLAPVIAILLALGAAGGVSVAIEDFALRRQHLEDLDWLQSQRESRTERNRD